MANLLSFKIFSFLYLIVVGITHGETKGSSTDNVGDQVVALFLSLT
jgi:hypothetical protein